MSFIGFGDQGTGNPDDPRGDLLPGEDDVGISPLARIRPKQGAVIALVVFGLLVLWGG